MKLKIYKARARTIEKVTHYDDDDNDDDADDDEI